MARSPNKNVPETWQFHALASIDSDRFRDHESAITGLHAVSPSDITHRERVRGVLVIYLPRTF